MTSTSGSPGGFERSHPSEGMAALEKEQRLPLTGWQQEVDQAKRLGLEAAHSIVDRNISTFSRGELPHYAGINTFMNCLLYTSPSPRDQRGSRMPSSA